MLIKSLPGLTKYYQSYVKNHDNVLIARLLFRHGRWLIDAIACNEQQEEFKKIPIAIGIDDNQLQVSSAAFPVEVNEDIIYVYIKENFLDYFPQHNEHDFFWDFYSDVRNNSQEKQIKIFAIEKKQLTNIIDQYYQQGWIVNAVEPWSIVQQRKLPMELIKVISSLKINFDPILIEKALLLAMRGN